MTLRQPEGPWSWNDETEVCVIRLFIRRPYEGGNRCSAIQWYVRQASMELGAKSNVDMIAAAVASRMPREDSKR